MSLRKSLLWFCVFFVLELFIASIIYKWAKQDLALGIATAAFFIGMGIAGSYIHIVGSEGR
jgi:hypothetical protein